MVVFVRRAAARRRAVAGGVRAVLLLGARRPGRLRRGLRASPRHPRLPRPAPAAAATAGLRIPLRLRRRPGGAPERSRRRRRGGARAAAALQGRAAAAVGQVGGGDPRPEEGGARVARHLRHGGGRRHRLRRGRAPVQGHQGQAQLPGARPGPHRPRVPGHARHPRPPRPSAGWRGRRHAGNAAAAPSAALPAPDRRAVPEPDAVRAAAAGRRPRRGPPAAGGAVHDDGRRPRRRQPSVRWHRVAVIDGVGTADTGLLDAAAHPAWPAVARRGNVLVGGGAVDAVIRDHGVVAQRECMAVRRGAAQRIKTRDDEELAAGDMHASCNLQTRDTACDVERRITNQVGCTQEYACNNMGGKW